MALPRRTSLPPPPPRPLPFLHLLFLLFLFFYAAPVRSQQRAPSPPSTAPAPAPDAGCNGVFLTYNLEEYKKIRPFTANSADQPYSFKATATVLNNGVSDLKSWSLLIGFAHRELVVGADTAVLTDGSSFPYNTTGDAATSFSGYPNTDLKTAIETAGDVSQIEAKIALVGTLFGAKPQPAAPPLPASLSFGDPSYACPPVVNPFNTSLISTCCIPDPNFNPNATLNTTVDPNSDFLPRRSGDLTIAYDVLQAYSSSYLALVTIENHSPLGRLDHWQLSWEWGRDEFIYKMKGAYPTVIDSSECIFGKQGQYYQSFDFSTVLSCARKPAIIDLPPGRYNDTQIGRIEHCCRNGTLLPKTMDPSQSVSAFQMEVFKMPPDVNRTKLYPPKNFNIVGTLNPDYKCGQPMRVAPTVFPDSSGLDSDTLAVASWQIVCNISRPKGASPKCCVSYSAFYNDSVIPCPTCACGCRSTRGGGPACNATAEALLLPPEALLVPFDNRTAKALAWAEIKHHNVPRPMPCADNCGVSINWHISTDYNKGWSARVTLFNWDEVDFADWFLAVRMDKAYPGYLQMYSFNGTAVGNNTIFMQGFPGLNYLMAEVNGTNPDSDPRVPGKQQSVITFDKRKTPGINVVAGDGFPTKVYFNGEECALPYMIPTSYGFRTVPFSTITLGALVVLIASVLLSLDHHL